MCIECVCVLCILLVCVCFGDQQMCEADQQFMPLEYRITTSTFVVHHLVGITALCVYCMAVVY